MSALKQVLGQKCACRAKRGVLNIAPRADTRVCSTMILTTFALAALPATHAVTKPRVVVSTRVTITPRMTSSVSRKYLGASACRGVVVVSAASTPHMGEEFTRCGCAVRGEPPLSSERPCATSTGAGALLVRVRKALTAVALGMVFSFSNLFSSAAPALAFGNSASSPTATATSTGWEVNGRGTNTVHNPMVHNPIVTAMKDLPVPIGDMGSIGMLAPGGMSIPYHGNNPGIALFMASGGVTVRMLINVVVIYMIHKYWMSGDQ